MLCILVCVLDIYYICIPALPRYCLFNFIECGGVQNFIPSNILYLILILCFTLLLAVTAYIICSKISTACIFYKARLFDIFSIVSMGLKFYFCRYIYVVLFVNCN